MRSLTFCTLALTTYAQLPTIRTSNELPPGQGVVVNTLLGPVGGIMSSTSNLRYYLAVPYAATTAGSNAFLPPAPRPAWTSVLDCTQWGAGCMQDHHNPDSPLNKSLDCLNVNIFTPDNMQTLLPVLVFIHGGAWLEGSNQGPFGIYSGAYMAAKHDVVVVTLNYRLGAFGWLYTGSGEIDGNFGIMDEIAALRWIQAEISAFGGDPNAVTLFGESAGAMSTGILMTLPQAEGLFHRVIMESNVAGFNYKNASEAAVYGATFCGLVNCSIPTGGCNATCIRAIADPNIIMDAWNTATGNVGDFILTNLAHILDGLLGTGPVLDGTLLTMEPLAAVEAGSYWASHMPIILGTNSNEGETFIYAGVDSPLPEFLIPLGYTALLDFNATAGGLVNEQARYNSSAYSDGRTPLSHVVTDYWFRCASERFLAAASSNGARTFAYRYDHVYSNSSIFPKFGLPQICATTVCHASELPFVFHNVPSFTGFTPEEDALSAQMAIYWTNFAKNGDPNIGTAGIAWTAWDPTERTTLVLNLSITTESSAPICSFWDSIGGYFF